MNLERSADGEYRFLRFDRFMAEALYGPGGFFQSGGQAGGSDGDFLTSPETGALFGRLWGRALDRFWEELGRPDPFVVIEAGAGAGTLARSVLRSQPECGSALALHLVEASQSLAALAADRLAPYPNVTVHQSIRDLSVTTAGSGRFLCHVLCSNELFDNLPCGVARRTPFASDVQPPLPAGRFPDVAQGAAVLGGRAWEELALLPANHRSRAAFGDLGPWQPMWVPLRSGHWAASLEALTPSDSTQPVPLPVGIDEWLAASSAHLDVHRMLHVDYGGTLRQLQARNGEWMRTYRGHARSGAPWDEPGCSDITVDVPTDLVSVLSERHGLGPLACCDQAEWLAELNIDGLVADAKRASEATAAAGGLEHLRARSVLTEAGQLTSRTGLGAFQVLRGSADTA